MVPTTALNSPHPRIETLNPNTFDYDKYEFKDHLVKLQDGILLLTLNRPKEMNAMTIDMIMSLAFAFELADADDRVKAVVMTGSGRAFCAGAALVDSNFGTVPGVSIRNQRDSGGTLALAIVNCRKLTISAINGAAVGMGITTQLPMDMRIISSSAKVGFPFAKRGITAESSAAFFLPRLVGQSKALELWLTADVYRADHPALLPLWKEIVPTEQVLPRALELAKRLTTENSLMAIAIMKAYAYRVPPTPEEAHLIDSQSLAAFATQAPDAKEGVNSFLEKRPANFKGTMKDLEKMEFYPWWEKIETNRTTRAAKL